MSLPEYIQDRQEAHDDFKRDGSPVVIIRTEPGTVDPANGKAVPGTDYFTDTFALLKDYRSSEIDGTNIMRGDRLALLSALDANGQPLAFVPAVGMALLVQDEGRKRVMNVSPLKPGTLAIFYRVQLRV